jgi:23S rRNA (pseudouridine1915-N3)-methyltransferase
VRLVVVQRGSLRDRHIAALREEYLKRFTRFGSLTVVESTRGGAAFWPRSRCWKVALDERGEVLGSAALARRLADWTMRHGEVAFAVGDADGHDAEALAASDARLSLSAMTLPHQLAHLLLCEQLYRAATILAGLPYHRA